MSRNLTHFDLFAIIKQGILSKKVKVRILNRRFFISILNILYKNGYIRFFYVSKDYKYIYIFLKYSYGQSMIQNIRLFSSPSKPVCLSFKKLLFLRRQVNSFGIVSTDAGLKTIDSCIFLKKGGRLICLIE